MILKNGKRIDGCTDTLPVGTVQPFLGLTPPLGYLVCQGQLISKVEYPELYNICKSTFGAETETHFYLPDLRGKTLAGYDKDDTTMNSIGKLLGQKTHAHTTGNHTLTVEEIPKHNHPVTLEGDNTSGYSWAIYSWSTTENYRKYGGEDLAAYAGGSQPHNHGDTGEASNFQPTVTINWIVKAVMLIPGYFTVENTLESTSPHNALSAAQGNILAARSIPEGGSNGQVLIKNGDDDYSVTWGDAAVGPDAIVGDGSIEKIVELSYEEYLTLEQNGQLEDATEYHINDWTESGYSEIKAKQVFLSSGENVETSLQSKVESLIVNVVLNPVNFSVISTSHYSEDIIKAHQEGKKIFFHIDYTNGTCISTLDLIEGTSAISQLILRMYDSSSYYVFLLRLIIGQTQAQLQRDRLLTDADTEAISDSLEAFATQVAEHIDERFESQKTIDDGQNTRLDVAEGNIDAIVGTVNTLSSNLSKTMQMVYSGTSGGSNAYLDTGLSVEGGYGGGAYLVTMTWHLASGDPAGTTVDIVSLPYSGTNFITYRVCELRNNANYSKHLMYQASDNKTLMFSVGGSGDAKIHIYRL